MSNPEICWMRLYTCFGFSRCSSSLHFQLPARQAVLSPYLSFTIPIPMMTISLLFFNDRFWLMHFVVKMKRNFHSLPPIPIPIPMMTMICSTCMLPGFLVYYSMLMLIIIRQTG